MVRKGTIDVLPSELRDAVNDKIVNENWTLDELVELIRSAGHEVSRSAVHRYSQRIETATARIQHSREMAAIMAQEIGPNTMQTQQGQLIQEMMHGMIMTHLADADDEKIAAKEIRALAAAIKDTAHAGAINEARELKIREEMAKQAADAVDDVAKSQGLSAETAKAIRAKILGIVDD